MRPRMSVVAGPPGSGKTTALPGHSFGVDAFNIDDRCATLTGSYVGITAALREDVTALVREGDRLEGTPYDARFEWGSRRVYCSELVFLVFERALDVELVVPQRFEELVLTPAARRLAQRRMGRLPRPDEQVVTPAGLAASELLWMPTR